MSLSESLDPGFWPEFEQIIDKDLASGHPGIEQLPLEDARRVMAGALVRWGGDRDSDVSVEDVAMHAADAPMRMRIYHPRTDDLRPAIAFFHGGGFVLGDLDTHDALASRLANLAASTVISVDYPRAPEASQATILALCRDAVIAIRQWAHQQADWSGALGIAGDSAGAWLAWQTLLGLAGPDGPVDGALLLYPPVMPECSTPSWDSMATRHFLTRSTMRWFWDTFLGGDAAAAGQLALPTELPRVDIVVGSKDPLLDECVELGRRLRESNAASQTLVIPGAIHGFAGMGAVSPRASALIADIFHGFGTRLRSTAAKVQPAMETGACAVSGATQ